MPNSFTLEIQKDTFQIGTFKPPFVLPTDYEERLSSLRKEISSCKTIISSNKTTKFDSQKSVSISKILNLAKEGDNFALAHLSKFLFYETEFQEEKWLSKVIMHTLAYGNPNKVSVLKAYQYGKMLLSEKNIAEALVCFTQLESLEFSPALATVGRIYYSSPLVQKDENLAKEKWEKAAELGHFIASLWLARLKIRQQTIYKKPFGCLNYAKVFIIGTLKSALQNDKDAYISILI